MEVELKIDGPGEAPCRDVTVVEEDVGDRCRAEEEERCEEEKKCTEVDASSGFGGGIAEGGKDFVAGCDQNARFCFVGG